MKLVQDDRLRAEGFLGQPSECPRERIQSPEIVGELRTQCSKPSVVSDGALWIACVIALCHYG
jgi:hypothetical protein